MNHWPASSSAAPEDEPLLAKRRMKTLSIRKHLAKLETSHEPGLTNAQLMLRNDDLKPGGNLLPLPVNLVDCSCRDKSPSVYLAPGAWWFIIIVMGRGQGLPVVVVTAAVCRYIAGLVGVPPSEDRYSFFFLFARRKRAEALTMANVHIQLNLPDEHGARGISSAFGSPTPSILSVYYICPLFPRRPQLTNWVGSRTHG